MTDDLPRFPAVGGQLLDATLHLLDRQVIDDDGRPVSYVNDVELTDVSTPDEGTPVIDNLIVGSAALLRLFGGRRPSSRLCRVAWQDVADVDVVVTLGISGTHLDVTWPERWVRDHIVRRIPGGDHAAE